MAKISLILLLTVLWAPSVCFGQAGQADKKLIQVKPSYQEASYVPQSQQPPTDPMVEHLPTPRDQMYVFWILGKLMSYPIDKAESYVLGMFKKRGKQPTEVEPTPASAASTPNPFKSVDWREIPPAPPVSGETRKGH